MRIMRLLPHGRIEMTLVADFLYGGDVEVTVTAPVADRVLAQTIVGAVWRP